MTDDPTLFDALPVAPARSTDMRTSHVAANAQTPEKVAPIRAAVLLALDERGPMTDAELWDRLGGSESSPRKRRGELTTAGFVVACGEQTSDFGKPTTLWRLTDFGEAFVNEHRSVLIERTTRRKR